MKERFYKFMAGRYGNDQLGKALLILDVILLLLGCIFSDSVGGIFSLLAIALLVYIYFRMFSRNIYRRQEENGKYLRLKYKIATKFKVLKERWVQRKEYKFFTCPSCRATLRVPRGRGKIKIVCRKCGTSFEGKS
jgi:ribosomal protein L37AE/L43A